MKKLLALALFSCASLSAQVDKKLVGTWEFVKTDVAQTEKAGLHPSYTIKDFTLELSASGALRTTELHRSITGTWTLSDTGNTLEAELETGRLLTLSIRDLTSDQLTIQYRNGIQVLKRTSAADPAVTSNPLPKTVVTTNQQVAGRWKASAITMADGTKVPASDMPDIRFGFQADGALEAVSQGQSVAGNWRLGPRSSTLLASLNGETIVFYVLSASDGAMTLREGPKGMTLALSRLP
ncbi:MAG TPA: hypothetical protein VK183_13530 [Flavobacterium sp.]|nr:hypothetical protein [Flavobacterium sp.]